MVYRVYYTEPGNKEYGSSKLFMLPSAMFVSMQSAVTWAKDAVTRGAIVWRIIGPNGFVMTQAQFESKYVQKAEEVT